MSSTKSAMDFVSEMATRNGCGELLTKEEEIELFKQYKAGNKRAKDKLILSNVKLVFNIVNKHYGKKHPEGKDDLIQEGMIGLCHAVDRFDTSFDVKFATYAFYRILQRINRFSEARTQNIRFPNHIRTIANKYKRYCYDNSPTKFVDFEKSDYKEVMKVADCKEQAAKHALDYIRNFRTLSLSSFYDDAGNENEKQTKAIEKDELIEVVAETLSKISPLARDILFARFEGIKEESDKFMYQKIADDFVAMGHDVNFYKVRSIIFSSLEKILFKVSQYYGWRLTQKQIKSMVVKKTVRSELAEYVMIARFKE